MAFPRAIGANQYIQPLYKLKVGIGENGKILKMKAL